MCIRDRAYTFVRFLFLYDPSAAAKLPAALRVEKFGPPTTRLDKALKEHFGKGLDDLEPLWRAFSVEIR